MTTPEERKNRFDTHVTNRPRVTLTAAEQEELKRRSQNHDINKDIMVLKDQVKAITFCMALLKESRDDHLASIKELEASKRAEPRGGA